MAKQFTLFFINAKRAFFLVLFLFSLISLIVFHGKDMRWNPIIQAEGLGYYSYLPATFIYQDFSWKFGESLGAQYYDRDIRYDFVNEINGRNLNKYYPGEALLLLPFFLLAHLFAILGLSSADGYSIVYQYGVGIGSIFYSLTGLYYTYKTLLGLNVKEIPAFLSITSIYLGTNLYYNTVCVPSQSHVYSFAAIAASCYYFMFFLRGKVHILRSFVLAVLLLSIAIIIRPVAALAVLVIPAFSPSFNALFTRINQLIKQPRFLIYSTIAFCIPVLLLMSIWYIQSGDWVVYAYKGEHFYFSQPNIFNILFSFRKGWITYHPLVLISFLGLVFLLLNRNYFSFSFHIIFWGASIYLFSCWWTWTYSVPFGQRVFIDYYSLLGVLLGYFLNYQPRRWFIMNSMLILLLSLFNIYRSWQYHNGIIPWEYATSKEYFSSINKTSPQAHYLVNESRILNRERIIWVENNSTDSTYGNNRFTMKISDSFRSGIIHFRVHASVTNLSDQVDYVAVIRILKEEEELEIKENYLHRFLKPGKPVSLQLGWDLREKPESATRIEFYFHTPENAKALQIQSLNAELLLENPEPEFIP
jgi:hypothetical protein